MDVKDVNADELEQLLQNAKELIILDLWAEWCHPCKRIEPYLHEIAQQYPDQVRVVRLNVDHYPQVPAKYGVMGIPTVIFFKDGEEKDRMIGAQPKRNFIKKVQELIE